MLSYGPDCWTAEHRNGRRTLHVRSVGMVDDDAGHAVFRARLPQKIAGDVLMIGLGFGRDLAYLLSLSAVDRVTVIESAPAVIERFCRECPEMAGSAEIVEGEWPREGPDPAGYDWVLDTRQECRVYRIHRDGPA